jgi:hypothetical protein
VETKSSSNIERKAGMDKLRAYKKLHRMTINEIEEIESPLIGVYVVAYKGEIIYVGRTMDCITFRFLEHYYQKSDFGKWLRFVQEDWQNVRLDVLEPQDASDKQWLIDAERELIKKFNPVFNIHHSPETSKNQSFDRWIYRKHSLNFKQLPLPTLLEVSHEVTSLPYWKCHMKLLNRIKKNNKVNRQNLNKVKLYESRTCDLCGAPVCPSCGGKGCMLKDCGYRSHFHECGRKNYYGFS